MAEAVVSPSTAPRCISSRRDDCRGEACNIEPSLPGARMQVGELLTQR